MNDMDIQAGFYKARAVAGSEQYGTTDNGYDQIAFEVELLEGECKGRRFTTFLVFSDAAAPFALERLRACGWAGGNDMTGIDKNEITVQAKYEDYKGQKKLKVEIATGGGRVTLKQQMDEGQKRGFMARLNAMAKQDAPAQTAPQSGPAYPPSWDDAGKPPAQHKPPVL